MADLLQRLRDRDESPWKDIRGKPLDDRGLASRLKQYGIKSRDVWMAGKTKKGYQRCVNSVCKEKAPAGTGASIVPGVVSRLR